MIDQNIKDIIQNQDPNTGMDQLFFTNKALFDLSYEAVFKKQWVFLTHLSYFNENNTFIYQINGGFVEIKKSKDDNLIIGLKIIEMQDKGPLFEKGVRVNDIIVKINNKNASWSNLINSLKFATLGEELSIDVINQKNKIVKVEFDSEILDSN